MIGSIEDKQASGNRIFPIFFISNILFAIKIVKFVYTRITIQFSKKWYSISTPFGIGKARRRHVRYMLFLNLLEIQSQNRVLISLLDKSCSVCATYEKATDHWRSIISVKLCNLYLGRRIDRFRPSRRLLIASDYCIVETMKYRNSVEDVPI